MYWMACMVLMQSHGRAGYTFWRKSMFSQGLDHKTGRIHGAYTLFTKSVVTNKEGIVRVDNIWCQDYGGGNNTKFVDLLSKRESYAASANHRQMGNSMFAIARWANFQRHPQDVYDICGKFHTGLGASAEENLETSYELSDYMAKNWNWVHDGASKSWKVSGPGTHLPPAQLKGKNTVVWQAVQWDYDAKDGKWSSPTQQTGHWGPNVGPGVAASRRGHTSFVKHQAYAADINVQLQATV
jgi:hypothetical protein